MTAFSDFDGAVAEFMQEFGFTATYLQPDGTSTYDPATGTNSVNYLRIPVKAVQMDLNLRSNGTTVANNTLIQSGDKQLYIQPPNKTDAILLPLEVNPSSDKVEINGVVWRILTFKEITPSASDQILIELYIRK